MFGDILSGWIKTYPIQIKRPQNGLIWNNTFAYPFECHSLIVLKDMTDYRKKRLKTLKDVLTS